MEMATVRRPVTRVQPVWRMAELLRNGSISLDAPYQRDVVWPKSKMSALIDSLIQNYYIPPVVFTTQMSSNGKVVRVCIDGKQRLSSILRFVSNELPLLDDSTGESLERYYTADENSNRLGLTEEQSALFNDAEIVCVEYKELTRTAEWEIFSRVQLGLPLSPSEKLKSYNTPIADYIRELWEEKRLVFNEVLADTRARVYSTLTFITFLVYKEPDTFPTMSTLEKFLGDRTIIPNHTLRDKMAFVVDTLSTLMTKAGDKEFKGISQMSFIMIGYYISRCKRLRSVGNLLHDISEFRDALDREPRKRIRIGTPGYKAALEWINRYMDELCISSAMVRTPLASESNGESEIEYVEPRRTNKRRLAETVVAAQPYRTQHHTTHAVNNRQMARRGRRI